MKSILPGLTVGALGVLGACGPSTEMGTEGTASSTSGLDTGLDDTSGSFRRRPYRDHWIIEADLDFIHVDDQGLPLIFDLTIGGQLTNDNFANHGDVIVSFDGPPDRILVELRRFTYSDSEAAAQEDFDDLSLWAYSAPPGRPQDQDPADDCVAGGWHDGCSIRVYFDGLSQLMRAGTDLRVTLPPDYRRRVSVVTEDNDQDRHYLDRADVCISNLHASASVETDSGNVWVSLAPDATPVPSCTPQQIQSCEDWTVLDGAGMQVPAPWAPECDCIAVGGGQFGLLDIENRADERSNVTIDVPAMLWTAITVENQDEGQDAAGEHCEASVTVPDFEPAQTGNDFPWQARGSASFPGPPAILGAGFQVLASSSGCGEVVFTPDPESYVGEGNEAAQPSEERGNLQVCSGCIVQTCDELVP